MLLKHIVVAVVALGSAVAASADSFYSPAAPITITASGKSPTFSSLFSFSLDTDSVVSGSLSLLGSAGQVTALKTVGASVWQQTGADSWTRVWEDHSDFKRTPARGSWLDAFDELALSKGNYRLSLEGSVYSGLNYKGNYQYMISATTVAPAVPEPETYALMGLGLTGLLLARRRRH